MVCVRVCAHARARMRACVRVRVCVCTSLEKALPARAERGQGTEGENPLAVAFA